ncbi:prephenate/arogenate dehydrogenase [Synechococcus sp. Tobar12-5m-g]|uniref:prephenate/arogenate dehydrogenase n=1 Tax=unclassified Synechococcus TaxID=2626047 RepID=UPI0020CF7181|nr:MULTISPECIES: prephenate/arogenate dehydrogenase [unclassified Synechococcus]MCP9773000.1 prephenate/arogenate dehydrogenase [Synechococcus sp. Tobar12-5m-g]MCP9873851.1 prephenate/arogenate dehydrogenase [Synechococcus sp. Cruz CV-v-12]
MTSQWQQQPVGLVGLGLIGGSLGLDLVARGLEVRALVHRPATAERARQRGLASRISTDPDVLAGCGLLVLALPLDRLLEPPAELIAALPAGAVITDVGSVKAPVLRVWQGRVPRFVASHPMTGTAEAGVEAGQRDLFRGRPWVATPVADTDPAALAVVRELATALGADWLECAAADHDQAVALISHLPVLVSAALLQAADRGAAAAAGAVPALARALASSGFADTTRVGAGNPELGTLMARCNREAVLQGMAHYRSALEDLEQLVEQQRWREMEAELDRCRQLRPPFV